MNKYHDILLVTLPPWDMFIPACGPGVLKGIVESHGYSLKVYDTPADLFTIFCQSDSQKLAKTQSYFLTSSIKNDLIDEFYQHVIDKIKTFNFKTLAFSVFSVYTHRATFELLTLIREQLPDVKILVGGRGLTTKLYVNLSDKFTKAENLLDFNQILTKRKLVDFAILGDAEEPIIEFLKQQLVDTVTVGLADEKLDYPFSNLDDINLDHYIGMGDVKQMPVISSKGCVRSCDFCDVAAQMGRFKSKDGYRLAEEIIYLSKKYNVVNFSFTDSVINGNMKELRKTCQVLADYNKDKDQKDKIRWGGNWICRPPNGIKPEFFDLMKEAGCQSLTIGAEHGSNRVLEAMDKKTTVEGLYYELEQCYQRDIKAILNNIVGHWSEYPEDFLKIIEMAIRLGPYYASKTIIALQINDFALLRDTPAERQYEHNGIETIPDTNFTKLWWTPKNPRSTLKARLARKLIYYRLILNYNIPVANVTDELFVTSQYLDFEMDQINDFFQSRIDPNEHVECETISWLDNVDDMIDNLTKEIWKTTEIELEVNAHYYNGAPGLNIFHNDRLIFSELLLEGVNNLSFTLENDYSKENQIKFEMFNKNMATDTLVDAAGNIVQDKKIDFLSVKIDKTDIVKDHELFYNKTTYMENNVVCGSKQGLYADNSSLQIDYSAPFWSWALKNTKYGAYSRISDDKIQTSELFNDVINKLSLLKY